MSGSDIFVTNYFNSSTTPGTGFIGEYTTSGSTVNTSLVSGLDNPSGIAVSGSDIFVAITGGSGSINEYTTAGVTVGTGTLISSGLTEPEGIAVSGSDLFVDNFAGLNAGAGSIGEYTTSGLTVSGTLVSGLNSPFGIAVEPVPEPSTWALLAIAGAGSLLILRRRRAKT